MAIKFTRAEIRRIVGDSCTDEIENGLVALHLGVVDGLKAEIDSLKQEVEKPATEADEWKKKYESEHNDYEAFKKNVENEKVLTAKRTAYKSLAQDAGLNEKGIEKALKYADWGKVELDEDGKVKDAKAHIKNLKEEWAEHIVTTKQVGANTATPATNTGGTPMTKADIYKRDDHGRYIMSTQERQDALIKLSEQQKGT